MENVYLIVGLGNPGTRYENTRHNVGFLALDYISAKYAIKTDKLKHKSLIGDGNIGGQKVILVKPQTFMNSSGEAVRDLVEWYKIPLSNLIVIYDDIDLPAGRIRLRPKGSAGTHNGMRSILYQIQSEDFMRIRVGISRPPENWDLVDYVLGRFNSDERKSVEESIEKIAEAVAVIISEGIETAMNRYNK
jgi:PTH1 family peptidyl-tRNA hydrolase